MLTVPKRVPLETYLVTETIIVRKEVRARNEEQAREKAYKKLPDYEAAGWELVECIDVDVRQPLF